MDLLNSILKSLLYVVLCAVIIAGVYSFISDNPLAQLERMLPSSEKERVDIPDPEPITTEPVILEMAPPAQEPEKNAQQPQKTNEHYAIIKKGIDAYNRREYKEAAEICDRYADIDKRASVCSGLARYFQRDFSAALPYLERALEPGSEEFICRKYLAYTYYFTHNFDKSLENTEKGLALKKDPELEAFHQKLLKEKSAHRNYASESTNHFKVQFDGYEHGAISRSVISTLEDAYASVGKELNYYPKEPITVILYTNHDFYDITQLPRGVGGVFSTLDGKIRVPVRGAEKQEAMLRTVLIHEYVHALIHSIARNVPLWIHEGMAEYFSKGSAQQVWQGYLNASRSGTYSPDPSRHPYWGYHYAISMLIEKYSMYRLREMLDAMAGGKDYRQAFQDTYKLSIEDFLDGLRRG